MRFLDKNYKTIIDIQSPKFLPSDSFFTTQHIETGKILINILAKTKYLLIYTDMRTINEDVRFCKGKGGFIEIKDPLLLGTGTIYVGGGNNPSILDPLQPRECHSMKRGYKGLIDITLKTIKPNSITFDDAHSRCFGIEDKPSDCMNAFGYEYNDGEWVNKFDPEDRHTLRYY